MNKIRETQKPSFGMISCTEDPIETLFAAWAQSRPTQYPKLFEYIRQQGYWNGDGSLNPESYGEVVTKDIVANAIHDGVVTEDDIKDVFRNVSAMSIPVSESIHFTWGFTSLPIEWREQAVRKRQWGFWLTSMREFGMDDFVTAGRYAPPAPGAVSDDNGGLEFFHDAMLQIEKFYNTLKHEYGWPQEIARKVIPSCATHNGTMFSTFRTLAATLEARSCWIAQVDLWGPVIVGIVNSLKKVHPMLGMIVSPPCFEKYSNEYKGCAYKLINENRLSGKDPYAPCPLFCMNEEHVENMPIVQLGTERPPSQDLWVNIMAEAGLKLQYIEQGERLLQVWSNVWQRDPFSGTLNDC